MKSSRIKDRSKAFTLLEICVVILTIALVVLLILPSLATPHRRPYRFNCTNNLKQVALAFRMWGDDNGVYPMQFRTNNFDGPSYAMQQKMFVYYQAMSNELSTPKILVCPDDVKRTPGTNFTTDFDSSKVSYFVGLDANETNGTMFLAGDSNISNGRPPRNGILQLLTNQPVNWTKDIHNGQGNLALADGSVQYTTSHMLRDALQRTGVRTNRLALP